MTPLVFRSRIDVWLLLVLAGAVGISLYAMVLVLMTAPPGQWWTVLVLSPGMVLPLWLLLATDYTLDDDSLRVRCGPFRWRVPLASIRRVTPSRSLLSAPALSLRRLSIEYGRGQVLLISPRDMAGFSAALEARRH